MRPLLIGGPERAKIAEAIRLASLKPMLAAQVATRPDLFAQDKTAYTLEDRKAAPAPDCATANVELPTGYRVALTFEEQPIGMCKHLSISVGEPGDLPNPHAVAFICDEYGMRFPPIGRMWLEEFEKGHSAVNVVDLIGEPPDAERK